MVTQMYSNQVCAKVKTMSTDHVLFFSTIKRSKYTFLRTVFYTTDFQRKICSLLPRSAGLFHAHVSFELSLAVNTLGVGEGVVGVVFYLLSERSYSPETPAGDLHALEQPRANQIHFSAQEHHRNVHMHRNKHTH